MFKTKNDLPEATRVKAIELLNARLADCKDLQTQVKQAHWNVKGPNFISLHLLFDGINEEVEDYMDDNAERSVQPGGVAEGAARMVVKRSTHALGPETALDTLVEPGDYRARRRTGMPPEVGVRRNVNRLTTRYPADRGPLHGFTPQSV